MARSTGSSPLEALFHCVVISTSIAWAFYPALLQSRENWNWEFTNFDDDVNFVRNRYIHPTFGNGANGSGKGDGNDGGDDRVGDAPPWAEKVRWIFFEGTVIGVYEPVALLFKALLFEAFGMSARVVVRASVILHVLNTCGGYLLSRCLLSVLTAYPGRGLPRGQLAQPGIRVGVPTPGRVSSPLARGLASSAIVFGVHPLRSEVVAWCSGQPYLIACAFTLLSLYFHMRHRSRVPSSGATLDCHLMPYIPGRAGLEWFLSVACMAFAILSKAAVIGCVVCLPAIDLVLVWLQLDGHARSWKPSNSLSRRSLPAKILSTRDRSSLVLAVIRDHVITIAVALAAVSLASSASDHGDVPRLHLNVMETALRACRALCGYALSFVFPRGLCPLYYVPPVLLANSTPFGVPLVFVVLATLAAVAALLREMLTCAECSHCGKVRRSNHGLLVASFSWLLYVALASPTLGIVSSHVCMLMADRYVYPAALFLGIPLLGWVFSAMAGRSSSTTGARVQSRPSSRLQSLLMLMLMAAMGTATRETSLAWRTSESLWRRAVHLDPYSEATGAAGGGEGRDGEPVGHESGHTSVTSAAAAVKATQKPRLGRESAHYNLAVTLERKGSEHADAAIAQYQAAISINQNHPKSWSGLAMLHHAQGRAAEAVHAHRQAITLQPTNPIYHYNLGNVLMEHFKLQEAADCFRQSTSLDPAYWKAQNNLGNVLRVMGDLAGAERAYRACIFYNEHPRALKNLGLMVRDQAKREQDAKKLAEALSFFRRAVAVDPRNKELRAILEQTSRGFAGGSSGGPG